MAHEFVATEEEGLPMHLDPTRVRSVFWETVQYHDPADRREILARCCWDDVPLRRRIEALLNAHDDFARLVNEPNHGVIDRIGDSRSDRGFLAPGG